MALQLEDGTGRADAESFVSVTEIGNWASARGLSFSGTVTEQEQHARKAADYLCNGVRFRRWRGTPTNALQALPYPRVSVVTDEGMALPDGTIPNRLKWAQSALAVMVSNGVDLQPSYKQGGAFVVSKSVGPLSTTWAQGTKPVPYTPFPAETLFTEVIGYLAPLLIITDDLAETTFVEAEVPEGYMTDTFLNNNG